MFYSTKMTALWKSIKIGARLLVQKRRNKTEAGGGEECVKRKMVLSVVTGRVEDEMKGCRFRPCYCEDCSLSRRSTE